MLKITLHGHACLTLRDDETTVLVDPGAFSKLDDVGRPDAILITHNHADHADTGYLAQSSAPIFAPADTIDGLRSQGLPESRLNVVEDGAVLRFGALEFQAFVGAHAEIYPGVPTPLNASYLVDSRLLVPGDAFPQVGEADKVAYVFLPISGPWLKLSEAVDFARAYPEARAVPIHDALLSAPGIGVTDRNLGALLGERYSRVLPETQFEA